MLKSFAVIGTSVCLASVAELNPLTYKEPDEAEYWGGSPGAEMPFKPLVYDSPASLSRTEFDSLIQDGKVFVVKNVSGSWAMKAWDCNFFKSDPELSQAEMMQHYTAGGGSGFVKFNEDWDKTESSSGAADPDAPQVAPFYWGIKDVQYEDAFRSTTWKKTMLDKIKKSWSLPAFMHPKNQGSFGRTPEFWFAKAGAGAKAHMDTHIQATISVQIAGTKRWRIRTMGARTAPYLAMIYKDGLVYKQKEKWVPHFSITLQPGDALFFPPGEIHETLTTSDDCAASVTFQFESPMASRFYRRFFPRVRRTADIHESWVHIEGWATLNKAGRNKKLRKGLPYDKAKELAPEIFKGVDTDSDGVLSKAELEKLFRGYPDNALGWHDLDGNGEISAAEFAEGFAFWADTVHTVMEQTPKEWRKWQMKDMRESGFNIEDLPRPEQMKMQKWAEKFESSGRQEL